MTFFAYHDFDPIINPYDTYVSPLQEGSDYCIASWYDVKGFMTDRLVMIEYIIPEGAD